MFKKFRVIIYFIFIAIILNGLAGCIDKPPQNSDDICSVFQEYPTWYWDVQDVEKHWGLPIQITMAVIYQESHFNAVAQPPREKLLGFIPWFRPTSAFGYAQSIEDSWRVYQRNTGHTSANRDDFGDAVDFIGWYIDLAHQKIGISKHDAYQIYLVYHEGIGGYSRGTYRQKPWLMAVAKKVARHAWIYHTQLLRCQSSLPQKPWWRFW